MMRNTGLCSTFRSRTLLPLLAFAAVTALHARGQALPVADKASDISVFAGAGHVKTDYGVNSNQDITAGLDFTRYFRRLPIDPSLEVRGTYVNSVQVTQKGLFGGLRLTGNFRRIHPYGDFLVGGAEITFHPDPNPGYTGDRGRTYSFGGGINLDVVHNISLMADYQQQNWNLGKNIVVHPDGSNFTLAPQLLIIGIHYRIPFRVHNHRGEVR